MTPVQTAKTTPPSLNELMVAFVNRSADPAAIEAEAGALGEVEPHEVAVGFRVDPQLAWREGMRALEAFGLASATTVAPAEWAAVVVRHHSIAAQPFALASYPQRVRDLSALLNAKDLSAFRTTCESLSSTALRKWAAKQTTSGLTGQLLTAAVLRASQDLEAANELIEKAALSAGSDACVENERATLLWQQGEWSKAAAIWKQMPDSTVAWFNRGMASLFLDQPIRARECLKKAVEKLPESSGWHHLGSLYLALAEIRK